MAARVPLAAAAQPKAAGAAAPPGKSVEETYQVRYVLAAAPRRPAPARARRARVRTR